MIARSSATAAATVGLASNEPVKPAIAATVGGAPANLPRLDVNGEHRRT